MTLTARPTTSPPTPWQSAAAHPFTSLSPLPACSALPPAPAARSSAWAATTPPPPPPRQLSPPWPTTTPMPTPHACPLTWPAATRWVLPLGLPLLPHKCCGPDAAYQGRLPHAHVRPTVRLAAMPARQYVAQISSAHSPMCLPPICRSHPPIAPACLHAAASCQHTGVAANQPLQARRRIHPPSHAPTHLPPLAAHPLAAPPAPPFCVPGRAEALPHRPVCG